MRIAIACNNITSTEMLRNIIASHKGYEVAWTALNGAEAVRKASHNAPDLILMGLDLPAMDGPQATEMIMKSHPCAILVVTDDVARHTSKVFEAMGRGALDVQSIPFVDSRGNIRGREELLRKIDVIERLIGRERTDGNNGPGMKQNPHKSVRPMIAIGSSTGGPRALTEIVSRMVEAPEAPVVIIQHVDVQFVKNLAEWLAGHTRLNVVLAKEGMHPEQNTIYVAGTNDHLILGDDLVFHYVAEPRDNPYRPSVDAFFLSIAEYWPGRGVAVLLTGMGRDGARGLLELRKAGWYTIAQDEKTSVIYGMPKAAARMDAAREILPIERIADAIIRQIKDTGRLNEHH